jgi:K+-transporting ATPase KdpF subunit
MNSMILAFVERPAEIATSLGYLTGSLIALLILAYLFYSLIKPERF